MDLFEQNREELRNRNAPLADRMRPRTLDEFIGQEHIIGPGRLLRRAIQIDQLSSVIFYGPPGTGKTTLARIIANTTKAEFFSLNAVLSGVKDIRDAVSQAERSLSLYGKRSILFVDEVHRFNKAQQDALLPHVENGLIILIGATTENPYFEVNKALVSRSRIFQLQSLTEDDLRRVARQALEDSERGYGNAAVLLEDEALDHLIHVANGDARGVLNALELAVETTEPDEHGEIRITREVAEESIQQRAVLYDKDGDAHYDTISAFIKSVRGSDPDAALYWMGKMVYAGEDPRFIFRRLLILASEDIGLADPHALGVVTDCAKAFDYVGMPEGRFHLAQACLYLSTAPKSNTTLSFFDALDTVSKEAADDVPDHLRDASRDGEGLGHGKGYLYPHAYRDHWVAQQYLPGELQGNAFYEPSNVGYEKKIRNEVTRRREAQVEAMSRRTDADPFASGDDGTGNARKNWSRRTAETAGSMLSGVRDRIFELAKVRRDSLVLDLHARTGLLTLEAVRYAPDGGVWGICHDDSARETLEYMARQIDTLSRPQIVRSDMSSWVKDLQHAAGETVRFDRILGRNVLGTETDKLQPIREAMCVLGSDGTIVLAETVFAKGQRPTELPEMPRSLRNELHDAESKLFGSETDPLMNWDRESVQADLVTAGFSVKSYEEIYHGVRRFSESDIEHWFRRSENAERPSLGDRLREVHPDSSEDIRRRLSTFFRGRDFEWRTVTAYFVISGKQ